MRRPERPSCFNPGETGSSAEMSRYAVELERLLTQAEERERALTAQIGLMRDALEHCRHRPHEHNPPPEFTVTHCEVIDRALATHTDKGET